MKLKVTLSKAAKEDLQSVPKYIAQKLLTWIEEVEVVGLEKIRLIPGFHDEPLKGSLAGARSIRLNRAYRATYVVYKLDGFKVIEIRKVHHHDY